MVEASPIYQNMRIRKFLILLLALPAFAGIIEDVLQDMSQGRFDAASSALQQAEQSGVTAETLEARSWLARGQLETNQLPAAETNAARVLQLAAAELRRRHLDAEPHLPTAVGAAIEVKAQVLDRQGSRAAALQFLRREFAAFQSTSIAPRIQKNINLLSLAGQPAPELRYTSYLGPRPTPLAALRGRPVLIFFWAHWCSDCRVEIPSLAAIKSEFAPRGLVLIGPTRLYGYTAQLEHAPPSLELDYITRVRDALYRPLSDVPMPVGDANFVRYGASTVPTTVLIGRNGLVRLYHPGAMTASELEAAVAGIM